MRFLLPALLLPACLSALPVEIDPDGTLDASWSAEWNTTGNAEGWSAAGATIQVAGGRLAGTASSTTPRIERRNIAVGANLDLGFNDFLEIRLQLPADHDGDVAIHYGTDSTPGFDANRVIRIPAAQVADDGAPHTYRIDVGLEVFWRGTLRDLRVDPLGDAAAVGTAFAIDFIRIGDEPGATSYQPRYTAECQADGGTTPGAALLGPGQTVQSMESKHFRLLWNDAVAADRAWTASMPRNTLRNLEESWQLFVKGMGYREPSQDFESHSGPQYKLNVTTWHGGYWAGGDSYRGTSLARLNVTPDGLRENPPTWVIPHELMHCMQMHNSSGHVPGAWWESHANYGRERWLQHFGVLFPANQRSGLDPTALRCAHQLLGHGRDYYLCWPFFLYVDENPDKLPDLGERAVVDVWQQTRAGEYSMMALERLTPQTSLKDIVGGYARRGATLDYANQQDMRAALGAFGPPLDNAATERWQFTELERRADDSDWWQVPFEMAPMQGAYAIHELVPEGGGDGRAVSVDFRGLPDSDRGADWRASLIVVADDGSTRYGELWNAGTRSVTLAADENRVFLSVAGAPDVFYDSDFKDLVAPYRSHPSKSRFPYELRVAGATPRERDNGGTAGLIRHANGGGYRAPSATVSSGAYLAPGARVLDRARVLDNARIEDFAVVSGNATVAGEAVVGGHAWVRGNATVNGRAKVRDWALVEGGTVTDDARILERGNLKGGSATGLATLKGTAASLNGTLSGNAIVDGDFGDFFYGRDIADGIAFGHEPYVGTPDDAIRPLPAGLYASYDFSRSHDSRILDQFGVTDGFTAGSPEWVESDGERSGFLELDGSTQHVLLDRSVADLREFTWSAWIRPDGGDVNQTVLWLGSAENRRLVFTPRAGSGKAVFSVVDGGAEQSLIAPSALPAGRWSHVAVTLDGTTGTLYLDGEEAASGPVTIRPDQLLAANTADGLQHNYLGRAQGEAMPRFAGAIDEVRFYATALPADEVAALGREPSGDACLPFDEGSGATAADTTGNGRDASLENGVQWGEGRFGGAVVLDGNNDHLAFAPGVVEELRDFTLSIWVRPDAVPNWTRIVDFGSGTDRYLFLTPRNSLTGRLRYAITAGGNGAEQWIDGAGPLPTGVWTHIAVTLAGAVGTLYVNGAPVGSNPAMTLRPADLGRTTNNWLGRSQFGGDPYFDGAIDEFRLVDRALSADEVAALALGEREAWRLAHFGTTANAGPAADDADPDLDGTINDTEFRLGLDPNDATSAFRANGTPAMNGFVISWPSANGLRFRIERSATLDGSWSGLATVSDVDEYLDPTPPAGRAFYRVVLLP